MNIYSRKQAWKLVLIVIAIIISLASLLITNNLVKSISAEERKKVELWAEGMRQMSNMDNPTQDVSFIFQVIKNNETVPVIVTDANDSIIFFRNIDSLKIKKPNYLKNRLMEMKKHAQPIEIAVSNNVKQYVYFQESTLLVKLTYYPYIQLFVIFLFILIAYLAFSTARKAEQNQVWIGMAKETAHQLGTPISSLLAWLEIMPNKKIDDEMVLEIKKDVKRLELIAERFSKIGSKSDLENVNIIEVLDNVINYMQNRTSSEIEIIFEKNKNTTLTIPLSPALFEWVIENLLKNAVDASEGRGKIVISIYDQVQMAFIDVKDEGKGIPKTKYKTVFQPGYTTKKRGWGLGLSLSKRIIESYHNGKIFVKSSEINQGTTFRIVLKK